MSDPVNHAENFDAHSPPITNLSEETRVSSRPTGQEQPSRLGEFFARNVDSNASYTDRDISEISSLLQDAGQKTWSDVPRFYIVLRKIDQLQLLDRLIDQGLNDYWFPFDQKSVPKLLEGTARNDFIAAQESVLTITIDLEKNTTNKHHHFKGRDTIPFEVRETLGRGAMSRVDKVFSLFSRREYARKLFKRSRGPSKTDIQAFMNELKILKRIRHQHCVELVASYTDAKYFGIIMLPVADCNLHGFYMTAINTPESRVVLRGFFGCLCNAIDYLHGKKIRHRDIKPENILVKGREVYLADFGISLDWENLSKSTTVADSGKTPAYCAPEVANHEKRNSSSDIWSLGCVFLEISTVLKGREIGQMRQYFKAQSDVWIFHKNIPAIEGWLEVLKACGSKLDDQPLGWIQSMLQINPELRPSAQDVYKWASEIKPDPGGQTRPFCADCCITDDGDDSDIDSISDDDLWVENSDEEVTSPASISDLVKTTGSGSANHQHASENVPPSVDLLSSSMSPAAKQEHSSTPTWGGVGSQISLVDERQRNASSQPSFYADSLTNSPPKSEELSLDEDSPLRCIQGIAPTEQKDLIGRTGPAAAVPRQVLAVQTAETPTDPTISVISPPEQIKPIGSRSTPWQAHNSQGALTHENSTETPNDGQPPSFGPVSSTEKVFGDDQEKSVKELNEQMGVSRAAGSESQYKGRMTVDEALIDAYGPRAGFTVHKGNTLIPGLPKISPSDSATPLTLMQTLCRNTAFVDAVFDYSRGVHNALINSVPECLNDLASAMIYYGLNINEGYHRKWEGNGPLYCVLRWSRDMKFRPLFQYMLRARAELRQGKGSADGKPKIFSEAARKGILWAIQDLITLGAVKPPEWQCDLMNGACAGGQFEVVEYLHNLEIFKVGEICPCSFTALNGASASGSEKIVRYLLQFPKELKHLENEWRDETPLQMAAGEGHADVVRLLLHHGARANDRSNISQKSPFYAACEGGHTSVLELLISAIEPRRLRINDRVQGCTALYKAALKNHIDVARLLLANGANVDLGRGRSGGNWTPLHVAAQKGQIELTKLLLRYGANVTARTNPVFSGQRFTGDTPISLAERHRHEDIMRLLGAAKVERRIEESQKVPRRRRYPPTTLMPRGEYLAEDSDLNRTGIESDLPNTLGERKNRDGQTLNVKQDIYLPDTATGRHGIWTD